MLVSESETETDSGQGLGTGRVLVPDEGDEANRLIDQYRHSTDRWQNHLARQGHSIAENYRAGRLSLVCDLDISVARRGVRGDLTLHDEPVWENKILASLVYSANVLDKIKVRLGEQQHVLVDDVEVMEMPEEIASPSLVWLYGIHDEADDCCGGLMFQSAIHGGYKFVPGLVDREFTVFVPLRKDAVQGVVQSRAEVVQGIADDKQNIIWNGLSRFDLDRIISSIRIVIDNYGVRASVAKFAESSVKILDMLVGPLDL